MQGILSTIVLMLFSALAFAQDGPSHPPSETVDLVYVAIFCILFVGAIVGFFIYLWMNERKNKQQQ